MDTQGHFALVGFAFRLKGLTLMGSYGGADGTRTRDLRRDRQRHRRPGSTQSLQPAAKALVAAASHVQKSSPDAAFRNEFASYLLPLLSATEAAEYLAVTPITVYRWCKRGKLPHTKVKGVIRIRATDLDQFIASNPQHRVGVLETGSADRESQ